jgi:DNA primase
MRRATRRDAVAATRGGPPDRSRREPSAGARWSTLRGRPTRVAVSRGASDSWRRIIERLSHPDVWGPGGLHPLEAFRRSGRGWVARCPSGVHPDRRPSFSMAAGRAFGHCFACGYRRTWIGFVLERQGHSPEAQGAAVREALAVLSERAGIPLATQASAEVEAPVSPLAVLAGVLKQNLLSDHPRAAACREYLAARGVPEAVLPQCPVGVWTDARTISAQLRAARLSPELMREHGLLARYLPTHPLLFLYEDAEGVTGFKCRKPSLAEKSVLNALGFGGAVEGRSLFAVSLAREAIARYGRVIVVEGEFDALGWHAASLAVGRTFELVALGGSAKPTVEKFRTLRALGARVVYLALDADAAGGAATAAACQCVWEAGLDAGILSMPDGCKDPDEVLARHGPSEGATRLFTLDRAEPGAMWLARHQLARCPPVTFEEAARLRALSAETARVMPASGRLGYAVPLAQALGVSAGTLINEWAQHAAEARARAVRDHLRRWASEWARRLDRGSLGDHLDEATRILTAACADLCRHAVADVEATPSPDSPVDGSRSLMEARQPGHDSVDMRQRMG